MKGIIDYGKCDFDNRKDTSFLYYSEGYGQISSIYEKSDNKEIKKDG